MSADRSLAGSRPSLARASWLGRATLRAQFTVVVFLLAFAPNLVLTLSAQPSTPAPTLALWLLAVSLISVLVAAYLSRALLRPLSRLQGELERGSLQDGWPDDPREIGALRRAFSELLRRLGTEQGRRNAFMATLVHDLKTPLIATGHLTRALTTLDLPPAERRDIGERIETETRRLLTLVQQMADAHRFERDHVQVHPEVTDLRDLLDGVARQLQPQAEAQGVRLSVSGQGHANVDPAVLARAAANLAENALRYAHSEVSLCVSAEGLHFLDDGPGLNLPLHELAQPFNAQPTTIAGHQYTAGAAGLGLYIARRIAESHGGELRYARLEPAPPFPARSRFTLSLPEVTP